MEERGSSRLVTQRQLEVEAPRPVSPPPTEDPAPAPPGAPAAPIPAEPSNRRLLERQLRWFRERARFESRRPDDEGSK
jgi:hypothetical protein